MAYFLQLELNPTHADWGQNIKQGLHFVLQNRNPIVIDEANTSFGYKGLSTGDTIEPMQWVYRVSKGILDHSKQPVDAGYVPLKDQIKAIWDQVVKPDELRGSDIYNAHDFTPKYGVFDKNYELVIVDLLTFDPADPNSMPDYILFTGLHKVIV